MSQNINTATTTNPPFPKQDQLTTDLDVLLTTSPNTWNDIRLPSQPRIRLAPACALWAYLEAEFVAAPLEQLAPHLWLMSTQSSANISPLHRQRVKRRDIVLTEDPRLHLVWHDERIFIKPLPPYLLSAAFWEAVLLAPPPSCCSSSSASVEQQQQQQRSGRLAPAAARVEEDGLRGEELDDARRRRVACAALGFLRTYTYLIQHASDLAIAHSHALLPPSLTSYTSFSDFVAHLSRIPDSAVSPRYAYGELRLSRLNVYAKLFLRRWYYFRLWPQYGAYVAQFYAPVLFVFGVLSVALGAMQVETAAEGLFGDHHGGGGSGVQAGEKLWRGFWRTCRWFSVGCLALVAVVVVVLLLLLLWRLWAEWSFALRERWRKRGERRGRRQRGDDDDDDDADADGQFAKGVV